MFDTGLWTSICLTVHAAVFCWEIQPQGFSFLGSPGEEVDHRGGTFLECSEGCHTSSQGKRNLWEILKESPPPYPKYYDV